MPRRYLADGLKEFAMRLVDDGLLTLQQCVSYGAFSLRTANRLKEQWDANARSLPPKRLGYKLGRPRKVTAAAVESIRDLIAIQPDIYLDELAHSLTRLGFPEYSKSLLALTLRRVGLSRKMANCYAAARSEESRRDYRVDIAEYRPDQLVFVDESGFNLRVCNRTRARSMRNTMAFMRQPFQRGRHITLLPALSLEKGLFALYTTSGSVNGAAFAEYLEDYLLPRMRPYPEPNSVIVCDNASVHKVPEVLELVRRFDCRIAYLPPYSPDFNPIEKAFNKIKTRMRRVGYLNQRGYAERE